MNKDDKIGVDDTVYLFKKTCCKDYSYLFRFGTVVFIGQGTSDTDYGMCVWEGMGNREFATVKYRDGKDMNWPIASLRKIQPLAALGEDEQRALDLYKPGINPPTKKIIDKPEEITNGR